MELIVFVKATKIKKFENLVLKKKMKKNEIVRLG